MAAFCKANGQMLLPLVKLIEQARLAVGTVLDEVSQQTVEMMLCSDTKKANAAEPRVRKIAGLSRGVRVLPGQVWLREYPP